MRNRRLLADMRGWQSPPPPSDEIAEYSNQCDVLEDLMKEYTECMEDAAQHKEWDRAVRIVNRTYRLTRGWSDAGFDLLRPIADELEPLVRLWARAFRRHLIRRYLSGVDIKVSELVYVDRQFSIKDDPSLQEDFRKVKAAIRNSELKVFDDLRAENRALYYEACARIERMKVR
jgi:hypothetical protein